MKELLAYTSSHVFLLCFLLALTLVSSKTKMINLLLFKQLLGKVTSDVDIYSAKPHIIRQWTAE